MCRTWVGPALAELMDLSWRVGGGALRGARWWVDLAHGEVCALGTNLPAWASPGTDSPRHTGRPQVSWSPACGDDGPGHAPKGAETEPAGPSWGLQLARPTSGASAPGARARP